jgi:hypothetical protein
MFLRIAPPPQGGQRALQGTELVGPDDWNKGGVSAGQGRPHNHDNVWGEEGGMIKMFPVED